MEEKYVLFNISAIYFKISSYGRIHINKRESYCNGEIKDKRRRAANYSNLKATPLSIFLINVY